MKQKSKRRTVKNGVIFVIVIVAIAFFGFAVLIQHPLVARSGSTIISIGGYSYNVLLATNQSQWYKGLMNYTFSCAVPGSCVNGMIFVFPSNMTTCFWMKNTPTPLVQIWILNGSVTEVYNAVPEDTKNICGVGNEVLELNSKLPINVTVGSGLTG